MHRADLFVRGLAGFLVLALELDEKLAIEAGPGRRVELSVGKVVGTDTAVNDGLGLAVIPWSFDVQVQVVLARTAREHLEARDFLLRDLLFKFVSRENLPHRAGGGEPMAEVDRKHAKTRKARKDDDCISPTHGLLVHDERRSAILQRFVDFLEWPTVDGEVLRPPLPFFPIVLVLPDRALEGGRIGRIPNVVIPRADGLQFERNSQIPLKAPLGPLFFLHIRTRQPSDGLKRPTVCLERSVPGRLLFLFFALSIPRVLVVSLFLSAVFRFLARPYLLLIENGGDAKSIAFDPVH